MTDHTTEPVTGGFHATEPGWQGFGGTKSETAATEPVLTAAGTVAESEPCAKCGKFPEQAPEGVKFDGSPHWTHPHCFACGYNPETDA